MSPYTFAELTSLIREQEVGRDTTVTTPFGERLIFYADLTATGRFVQFVETWLAAVRPFYANTHTAVSSTGRIMSALREEARGVVGRSVNAGAEDVVLFVGSGATAAVNKLVGLLGIRIPEPLERAYRLSEHIPEAARPVVFIGPYEHHSNVLPWVESIATVVEIGEDEQGGISLADLESKLQLYRGRPLQIGAFSAASNVTGVLTRVGALAGVLHRAGAYAVFDFAASGPYVPIDMHPQDPDERIDALFVSTHKFMGGPNASGVLVVSRQLFRSSVPERPGGGTVAYVGGSRHDQIDYVERLDEREEGGTPSIIGDVRAGVAFLLKEMLGPAEVLAHELSLAQRARERLALVPGVHLYGPASGDRLPIMSFNIDALHHDFVSTLLDHLFGIQNRAGCSCAGPYGHRLLGIDEATSGRYRAQIARGVLAVKPGWVRVSLPYYASEEEIEFVLQAIAFVAARGLTFLPLYRIGFFDGRWQHVSAPMRDVMPLELVPEALHRVATGASAAADERRRVPVASGAERARYLREAAALADALADEHRLAPPVYRTTIGDPQVDPLIWFRFVHAA
jgi:selenocysteine lyase/cysteine desulfurase